MRYLRAIASDYQAVLFAGASIILLANVLNISNQCIVVLFTSNFWWWCNKPAKMRCTNQQVYPENQITYGSDAYVIVIEWSEARLH